MTHSKYIVMVDDNFHFTDSKERYKSCEYSTLEEAVAKCKSIVDDYLLSALEPNMSFKELYASYTMFGEDPFIQSDEKVEFSAWKYAEEQSRLLTSR